MAKLKMLDLFCGAGGAGEGYQRAGFDVTGVDYLDQPNNPHKFIKGDAIEYLLKHGKDFDIIHASPPCQMFSTATGPMRANGKEYPNLFPGLRLALSKVKKPYIIENVQAAPIRKDLFLVGYMFGLKLIKKRFFELSNDLFIMQLGCPRTNKTVKDGDFCQVVGKGQKGVSKGKPFKYCKGSILKSWRYAMGIDWMKTYKELANAIPPAYTEWIGNEIYHQLT